MGNEEATLVSTTPAKRDDGDVRDEEAMARMGREPVFIRRFRGFTMFAFSSLSTASWEGSIFILTQSLLDGGRPNAIYSLIWTFVMFIPIYLSMAELSSMAPIAGAQYHWVSEFAPERCQKTLSYLVGWTSTLAWQAGNAVGFIEPAMLVQSMITINLSSYSHPNWHTAVISIALILIATVANIWGSKMMPHWQNGVFLIHIGAFFAFITPIWVFVPRADHGEVWAGFENRGGWPTMALSVLVGQAPGIYAHVGLDTATHMAEEVKDACKSIPRIMLYTFVMNMFFKLITIITFSYHITDMQKALDDTTGYPGLWVMRQSMSAPWLTALLSIIYFISLCGTLNYLTATTRDLYAFARDKGIIFSSWISQVDSHIPINAYLFSAVFSAILSLIYIGSTVAFEAITSLIIVALLACYLISISCILWRRIYDPATLPEARFSLGRWGIPVNASAVLFTSWGFFWACWPEETPVTLSNFNWAPGIFLATLLVALAYYFYEGRKFYKGPVTLIEGRR